ncbi:TPA: DEAD/DEAH box helicase, partial [Enterococcus faecium]
MNIFVKERANEILKAAYGLDAEFREDQLESIVSVVEKKKTLVIQKTGWGKSVVYFVATKILRENGSGPTIIISPLLALMKNQIESARKIGLEVATINSDNPENWEYIYSHINNFDALIISPERFSNDQFMSHLEEVQNVQLFVVDEAHSISDWGHDFRPDYQRIVSLLDKFPSNMAILGTTATANDRVILDI